MPRFVGMERRRVQTSERVSSSLSRFSVLSPSAGLGRASRIDMRVSKN